MSSVDPQSALSRSDFLRLAAWGAGGLGLAALAGCGQKAASDAYDYVFVITHGPKDPDRVIFPLMVTRWGNFPPGRDNYLWFCFEGAEICKKGVPEKVVSEEFPNGADAAQLIDDIRANNLARIAVSHASAERHKVGEAPAFDNLFLTPPDWFVGKLATHTFVWF